METLNRVEFERPALSELTQNYTVVDMHFHSRYSDGLNYVRSIAKRAAKLGIGVAVTDHNAIKGAVRLDNFKNILTIPGIEVTSKEGAHILVYFYNIEGLVRFYETDIKPFLGKDVMASISLNMDEIIKRARKYKNLIIFPHPYCGVYTGICNPFFSKEQQTDLLDMVDGVEVINAGNMKKWNLQCAVLGFNLGKSMTGGSDGHNLFQMGKSVTFADCTPDRESFLDAVMDRQSHVVGRETHLFQKVTSNSYKIRSSIKNSPHVMEKNVRYSYSVINSKSKQVKDSVQRRLNNRLRRHG
ncbi:MAG: PHP domain-containing protein [Desulfobacteraceae bacterium]|nr:PHP domain-containing protein [Desulfobacteraceae bacterium]MBC2757952.1 PHP domain-containing protein [Desulfobacteraceae bacterium]